MPDTPERRDAAAGDSGIAASLDRVVEHLDQVTDAYTAGRALTLGFQEWLSASKAKVTEGQRDAVLAAIARARSAVGDTIPRASLARVCDGLNALAEDVAASSGAMMFGNVDHAASCAMRIMLGQAEAATVAMLISGLFDDLEDRPRALVNATEWQTRASALAAEVAAQPSPRSLLN